MTPAELARQKLDRLEEVLAKHLDSEWVGFKAMKDFRAGADALIEQLEGATWAEEALCQEAYADHGCSKPVGHSDGHDYSRAVYLPLKDMDWHLEPGEEEP